MKILILCILALFLQGCPPAVLPIAATTGAVVVKYKWHKSEVVRIKEFRKAVLNELKRINEKLE